jgi:hypothetical protein
MMQHLQFRNELKKKKKNKNGSKRERKRRRKQKEENKYLEDGQEVEFIALEWNIHAVVLRELLQLKRWNVRPTMQIGEQNKQVIQTNKQTNKQANKQTNEQTNKQTNQNKQTKQTKTNQTKTSKQTNKQTTRTAAYPRVLARRCRTRLRHPA